jgi:ABC-2 type transport system permease protein
MTFRGLFRLTWLETKIFLREPLGVFGTVLPALIFIAVGRVVGPRLGSASPDTLRIVSIDVPVFTALLLAASTVLSLVAIIAIYREGGILRRLRATPLRPHTILIAHVMVKLILTAVTLTLMVIAGQRSYPVAAGVPLVAFTAAVLYATVCVLSLGFLIASLVPTARFAQPLGTLILYPMLAISGLFVPVDVMPRWLQVLARATPFSYAVSLLRGIWQGEGWFVHFGDLAVMGVMFLLYAAVSARVFRWE